MRRVGSWFSNERGASAVEFALVAVPLLLLIVGTVEYGRLIWTRQAMQSVALEAARCMGIEQTECSASGSYSADVTRQMVIDRARQIGVGLVAADVTLNSDATCSGLTGFSQVAISYTFISAAPDFISALATGGDLAVSACFPNQS